MSFGPVPAHELRLEIVVEQWVTRLERGNRNAAAAVSEVTSSKSDPYVARRFPWPAKEREVPRTLGPLQQPRASALLASVAGQAHSLLRSEERRVGKEGRCAGAAR